MKVRLNLRSNNTTFTQKPLSLSLYFGNRLCEVILLEIAGYKPKYVISETPVFFPLNIRFTSGIREVTNVEIKVWRANKFGRLITMSKSNVLIVARSIFSVPPWKQILSLQSIFLLRTY